MEMILEFPFCFFLPSSLDPYEVDSHLRPFHSAVFLGVGELESVGSGGEVPLPESEIPEKGPVGPVKIDAAGA